MLHFFRLFANLSCWFFSFFIFSIIGVQPVFAPGESYTYYCGSTSSQAQIITCSAEWAGVCKYFLASEITGESTVYASGAVEVESLLQEHHAQVLFTEQVGEIVNYYCRTPREGGVVLYDQLVNLHVAVDGASGRISIGQPLIFGGF